MPCLLIYASHAHELQGTDGKSSFEGAPYSDPHVNDFQFTDDLLDTIVGAYCIDTSRVFATGKSNGAGFVNQLACHPQSARFAYVPACA